MEDDHRVTSHLIPELLHEFLDIVTEALNHSICFFENVFHRVFSLPQRCIQCFVRPCGGIDSQALVVSE